MTKGDKFADEGYSISISGKNVEITNTIRDYINEKIAKIERFKNQIMDINVRIEVQKLNHLVDVVVKFAHFKIKVHANTENMYSAIDRSFDKLLNKMRRWKERISNHHARGVPFVEMEVNVLERNLADFEEVDKEILDENNRAIEEEEIKLYRPNIVGTKTRALKTLTIEEAMMKMELSGDSFLVFRSEEDRSLKVIYKRRDESYGLMNVE